MADVPQLVKDALLASSEPMPPGSEEVRGYDFSNGVDYHALLESYRTTGFQASNFGKAVVEINNMVSGTAVRYGILKVSLDQGSASGRIWPPLSAIGNISLDP